MAGRSAGFPFFSSLVVMSIAEQWVDGYNNNQLDSGPFESNAIKKLLSIIQGRYETLLRGKAGSGGNIVIQGCKGVGKTSILKAVEYAYRNNNNCEISYQEVQIHDLASLYTSIFNDIDESKYYIFLVDEIQRLFHAPDAAKQTAQNITHRLAQLAKMNRCLVIISGSSSDLTEYLFQSIAPTQIQEGYADFNYSVFGAHSVLPLRIKEDVEYAYYKIWEGKHDDIDFIFSVTGGLGRHIQTISQTHDAVKPPPIINLLECESPLTPLIYKLCGLQEKNNNYWQQASLLHSEARNIVKSCIGGDESEAKAMLDRYVANNYLYSDGTKYELFLPCWYEEVKTMKENSDFRIDMALFSCIAGWEKEGSAGSYVEHYLFSQMVREDLITTATNVNKDKIPNLNHIADENGVLINRLTQDFGLDGIWIYKGEGKWYVSGIQVKLGKNGKKITEGGKAACKKGNDQTIRGIFTKAIKGFARVMQLWKEAKRTEILHISEFFLLTNKQVVPLGTDEDILTRWKYAQTCLVEVIAEAISDNQAKKSELTAKKAGVEALSFDYAEVKVTTQQEFKSLLTEQNLRHLQGYFKDE